MGKSIKLLTEYFHPEPASTGQLMTELAVGLEEKDFDVEVYTSQPTYQGQETKKLTSREDYKGIKINRLSSTQLDKDNPLNRIINWLSFSFLTLIHLIFKSRQKDILLILSNPPILLFVGLFLNYLRGQRYVIIMHDVYPDMAVTLGVVNENGLPVKMWNRLNKILYYRASRIVVLGERMKQTIIRKSDRKIDVSKIRVIHNWEDPEFIKPTKKEDNPFTREHGYDNELTLLYSGNLGQHHDLATLVYAAERVKDLPIKFVFIGDGAKKKKLEEIVQERNLRNVDFYPYQPLTMLPETLTCGDISIISEDKRVNGLCVSCKIYSALASGQAILGLVSEDSDVANIIEEGDCGLRADQGDVEQVVEHIKFWLNNPEELAMMGERGRRFFEKNFTFEHALGKYVEELNQVG